jgi:hypothetical protein
VQPLLSVGVTTRQSSLTLRFPFRETAEIRYYRKYQTSEFGNIAFEEKGSIPLEYITNIDVPSAPRHKSESNSAEEVSCSCQLFSCHRPPLQPDNNAISQSAIP